MEKIALSIRKLVQDFSSRCHQLPENITTVKLSDSKWTLKEIIGHLIDSACNNHQRITRLQLDEELQFPSYENEKWLTAEKWNLYQWDHLLNLLEEYNLFLAHLIENVKTDCLQNRWHGQDRLGNREFTLEELITDYLRHFREHLDHFDTRLNEIRSNQ